LNEGAPPVHARSRPIFGTSKRKLLRIVCLAAVSGIVRRVARKDGSICN
jgi:hypothetical protein